jgi:hypothetical protein
MERRVMMAAHAVARTTLVDRLGDSLASVYSEYETIKASQTAASAKMSAAVKTAAAAAIPALTAAAFDTAGSPVNVSDSGVQLDAYAKNAANAKSLAASIKKLGGTGVVVSGSEVDAVVPASGLSALSKLKTLGYAQPVDYVVDTGSVTSQGDVAERANIARSVTGLTGAGVIVGIISDSFNNAASSLGYTDTENTDEASGDLPASVSVLQEDALPATDEGRAIAQVIYDSAPGVQIDFYSGASSQQAIAGGIAALQQAGAKVIINDITQLNEPMFEDGVAAQAAETAIAAGVTYISAAGNAGTDGYGAAWSNGLNRAAGSIPSTSISSADPDPQFYGGETYNFAPAGQPVNDMNSFTLGGGQTMKVSVQWDQPYYSVTNSTGNADQVDAYILETINGVTTIVGGAANAVTPQFTQGGVQSDPIQYFNFTNPGAAGTTGTFSLMIATEPGFSAPGYIKYVDLSDASAGWAYTASSPNNGTIFGTANAAGAIAVGAVGYLNTPAFGVGTPVIEPYSSVGGTPILFDTAGNRLATPVYRQQPLVDGPDQVATTFFGPVSTSTHLHVFSGTSASAAGVAGIAALLVQEAPTAAPAQIAAALDSTALWWATRGPNDTSGYGFVRADSSTTVLVGTVSGTVYSDNNTDGKLDNNEPGIGGVTVYIAGSTGGYSSKDLTTVTASNGTYSFNNVPTGSVTVGLILPGGYIPISATTTATVVGAATTAAINLGLFPTTFNSAGGDVSASVTVDPAVNSKIDITVGSTGYQVTKSLVGALGFILGGGNNTLTLNFANGNPTPSGGFQYTGSGGNNSFVLNGSSGSDTGYVNGNTTSFDSSPNDTSSGIANEIMNGLGGNDNFVIGGTPSATTLTLNGGVGNDTVNLDTSLPNGGSDVVFNAGTSASDNNAFNINTGSYTFPTDPSLTSSNLTVNVNTSSSVLFGAGTLGSGFNQRKIAALNLGPASTAMLAAPVDHADRTVLVTATLSMASTALLDMTGNDMIVTGGSLPTINGLVAGNFRFGSFNSGTGITSSTAAADTTHTTAVGVISNNQGGSALYGGNTPFDGQTGIPLNAVLLKYTYIGDTNLDGKVDGSDYSNIDYGYGNSKTGWFNGDVDYDGVVDGSDYSYMDNVFNNQGPQL